MALIDWLLGRTPPERTQLEARALGDMNIATVEVWPGYVVPVTEAYSMTGYAAKVAAAYRARLMTINALPQLTIKSARRTALARRPDPDLTRGDWLRETVGSLVDYGNAYWQLVPARTAADPPVVIRVLNPLEVSVKWQGFFSDRREYWWRERQLQHGRDIWHLALGRTRDELTGRGPMQHNRLAGVAAANDYVSQFFLAGGEPSGILKSEIELGSDEASRLRTEWLEAHAANTRTPAVLSGGLEYESLGLSPKETDWVGTHNANILDVAHIFGIPGRLLDFSQPGSNLTYGNITDVYLEWWRETLQPDYVSPIEEAWSEIANDSITFDPRNILRSNLADRYRLAIELITAGGDPAAVFTQLGLDPIPFTEVQRDSARDPISAS